MSWQVWGELVETTEGMVKIWWDFKVHTMGKEKVGSDVVGLSSLRWTGVRLWAEPACGSKKNQCLVLRGSSVRFWEERVSGSENQGVVLRKTSVWSWKEPVCGSGFWEEPVYFSERNQCVTWKFEDTRFIPRNCYNLIHTSCYKSLYKEGGTKNNRDEWNKGWMPPETEEMEPEGLLQASTKVWRFLRSIFVHSLIHFSFNKSLQK